MTVKDLIDTLTLIPQKFHDYEITIDGYNTDEARFSINNHFKELRIEIVKDIDMLWKR
jgi:hypothetical protein